MKQERKLISSYSQMKYKTSKRGKLVTDYQIKTHIH